LNKKQQLKMKKINIKHNLYNLLYIPVNSVTLPYINEYRKLFNEREYSNKLLGDYYTHVYVDNNFNLIGSSELDSRNTLLTLNEFKQLIGIDDFVLPDKWCIRDIPEVKDYFEKYNKGNYTCRNTAYLHYPRIDRACYHKTIQEGYTEITFEQFKKYVLKEDIQEPQQTIESQNKNIDLDKLQLALEKVFDKTDVEDIMDVIKKNI
jgi:hypothetical protein